MGWVILRGDSRGDAGGGGDVRRLPELLAVLQDFFFHFMVMRLQCAQLSIPHISGLPYYGY